MGQNLGIFESHFLGNSVTSWPLIVFNNVFSIGVTRVIQNSRQNYNRTRCTKFSTSSDKYFTLKQWYSAWYIHVHVLVRCMLQH
jgi:hypothetical protein